MGGLSKATSCIQLSDIAAEEMELEPTALYLSSAKGDDGPAERLYLPRVGTAPCSLDEYLSTIPHVVSRADELSSSLPKHGKADESSCTVTGSSPTTVATCPILEKVSSSRCLNVLQGEVAHASASQADIVVSAEATTCHVVALRSTQSESVPLVSLAHVDQTGYDACLDKILQEHVSHHEKQQTSGTEQNVCNDDEDDDEDDFGFFMDEDYLESASKEADEDDEEDEHQHFIPSMGFGRRTASMPSFTEPIDVELHMLGGFLDKDGTSQELSTSLVTSFSKLADKYRDKLRISLSTAAISCLNSEQVEGGDESGSAAAAAGGAAPRSRGLGIDTRTGEVFPVKDSLPSHLEGPAVEVRSASAWFKSGESLSVIHDTKSDRGEVRVEPFEYEPKKNLDVLLQVPDDVLLKYTSTSPEHESDNFCTTFRRTLSFVNTVPPEEVFGEDNTKSLVYVRKADEGPNQNEWQPVQQHR